MSGYDKYTRGQVLGKGSFGQAVLVTHNANGKKYVIKEIDISRMPRAERIAAEQEAKVLMALSHPNIVRCIECFTHHSKLCIVMDWCSEGDLFSICQKRRGAPLPEDTVLDWFVQICLGLKHVHDRKILHRDIKTQNVFMSAGGLLKLGDFGVSKVLSSTWQLAATAVGTPYYLSPEICANKRYGQKSDIWSLGCVLYELAVGKHAFEAANMRALIQRIIKGQYPPVPATRSKELRDLVDRMLTLNTDRRPSINDVLATPVVKARITKFLSTTLQADEFSHTVIHGRPPQGQLVVQAPGPVPKPVAAPKPAPAPAPQPAASPAPGALAGKPSYGGEKPGLEDARRQRELAAIAAHREVERMRLEEQRRKIEAERARMDADRRKAEAGRQEAEAKARMAAEAERRMAVEEARRRAEQDARQQKADEEARRKVALKEEKERKRAQERARIVEQRREFYAQREAAAACNRAAAEQQVHQPAQELCDALGGVPGGGRQRRQWVMPDVPAASDERDGQGARQGPPLQHQAQPVTLEQRRALWEEQRTAAERNRRAAEHAERACPPGLAGFLGVPPGDCAASESPGAQQVARETDRPVSVQPPGLTGAGYEWRRQRLEAEAAEREAAIRQYQQQHWRAMRDAAARNRAAVMAELSSEAQGAAVEKPAARHGSAAADGLTAEGTNVPQSAPDDLEFAAMIKDMQDVLVVEDAENRDAVRPRGQRSVAAPGVPEDGSGEEDEEEAGGRTSGSSSELDGCFRLNGQPICLPVREGDSLANKVEALRCYLEAKLGTHRFLTVYRRLESLSVDDDEAQVSREFVAMLGPQLLPYLQLIHQLIVSEETLNSGAA